MTFSDFRTNVESLESSVLETKYKLLITQFAEELGYSVWVTKTYNGCDVKVKKSHGSFTNYRTFLVPHATEIEGWERVPELVQKVWLDDNWRQGL